MVWRVETLQHSAPRSSRPQKITPVPVRQTPDTPQGNPYGWHSNRSAGRQRYQPSPPDSAPKVHWPVQGRRVLACLMIGSLYIPKRDTPWNSQPSGTVLTCQRLGGREAPDDIVLMTTMSLSGNDHQSLLVVRLGGLKSLTTTPTELSRPSQTSFCPNFLVESVQKQR